MALLATAFSLMILNGHPETVLHAAGLGAVWAIGEIWLVRGHGLFRVTLLGIGAGAIAMLLTAIFTLPILEAMPQTIDHSYRVNVYAFQKKSIPIADALRHLDGAFLLFIGPHGDVAQHLIGEPHPPLGLRVGEAAPSVSQAGGPLRLGFHSDLP